MENRSVFLTADWRNLVMLNFEIDPQILRKRLPPGTELDLFDGKALVSVVGFQFLNTAVLGIPIPLHRDFEEVNLRYYVLRRHGNELRRGVTFIKEMVPRWAVAQVARAIYNENFAALPMDHRLDPKTGHVEYRWRVGPRWYFVRAETCGEPRHPAAGSKEDFIVEHYWAYAHRRTGGCTEYSVTHAPWRVSPVRNAKLEMDIAAVYGDEFVEALEAPPHSAFVVEGSPVTLYQGAALPFTSEELAHAHA